jgi:hypothetical protein
MFKTKQKKFIAFSVLIAVFLYLGVGIIQIYQENKSTE